MTTNIITAVPDWITFLLIGLWVSSAFLVLFGIFVTIRSSHMPSKSKVLSFVTIVGAFLSWFILIVLLGKNGFFLIDPHSSSIQPAFPLVILGSVVLGYNLIRLSQTFRTIVFSVPHYWLTGIQAFRIGGGVFLLLYLLDYLPGPFAITAGTGDMFIGITALLVSYYAWKEKSWWPRVAKVWNYLGIFDLILAGVLAVRTSPAALSVFPLVVIPALRVPLAYVLHLYSLRRLRDLK